MMMTAQESAEDATQDRDELFRQWWPFMLKLGRQYLPYTTPFGRCGASAQDVAQEIALRAAKTFRTFDPERGKFSTWLGWVARSTAGTLREKASASMRSRHTVRASDLALRRIPDHRGAVTGDDD